MIVNGQIVFDAFTPINVLTGAFARYRGAGLPTLLTIATILEIAENVAAHHLGDRFREPDEPTRNFAVGLAATTLGWAIADAGMRGAFAR
jgi:hypothetical protein